MQANKFARNFNPPLTDLNDSVIVQALPFSSLLIGVPLRRDMSSSGEGISTPTLAILACGDPPPPIGDFGRSASTAPLSPMCRVVQPSSPSNVIYLSSGVVTGIPIAPFDSPSFMQTSQSGPSLSSSFIQGFPWNGGHIPPSTPYVGPTPAYVGIVAQGKPWLHA